MIFKRCKIPVKYPDFLYIDNKLNENNKTLFGPKETYQFATTDFNMPL